MEDIYKLDVTKTTTPNILSEGFVSTVPSLDKNLFGDNNFYKYYYNDYPKNNKNTDSNTPSPFIDESVDYSKVNSDIEKYLNPENNSNIAIPEFRSGVDPSVLIALKKQGLDFETLANRMISDGGTLSSNKEEVDKYLIPAMYNRKIAGETAASGISASFNAAEERLADKLGAEYKDSVASALGGETSMYARAYAKKQIDESIRDLESRKQSALAENNSSMYKDLSDLQVKQYQLKFDVEKNYIDTLTKSAEIKSKGLDSLTKLAEISRNMTKDELDYNMDVTRLKMQNSSNSEDRSFKYLQLKIMAAEKGIDLGDYTLPSPKGWTNRAVYTGVVKGSAKKMGDMIAAMNAGEEYQNDTVTWSRIYSTMLSDAQANAKILSSTGQATNNAVLKTYGFLDEPGTPLVTSDNKKIYRDGTVKEFDPNQYKTNTSQLNSATINKTSINDVSKPKELSQAQLIVNDIFGSPIKTAYAYSDDDRPIIGTSISPDGKTISTEYGDNRSIGAKIWDFLTTGKGDVITIENRPNPMYQVKDTTKAEEIVKARGGVLRELPQTSSKNLNAMLTSIASQEGFFGNRGDTESTSSKAKPVINNNPGNLVFAGQPGAVNNKGFAKFNTVQEGWKALEKQLILDLTRRDGKFGKDATIVDYFKKYAPKSDGNNPTRYASEMSNRLGINPNMKLYEVKEWIGLD